MDMNGGKCNINCEEKNQKKHNSQQAYNVENTLILVDDVEQLKNNVTRR